MAGKKPKEDFASATALPEQVRLSDSFPRPKPFAKDTRDHPYTTFLMEVMLFLLGFNCEPPMWMVTFETLLEGKARRLYQQIQTTHHLITFQDVAIELGNRLCPPPNEITIELRLEALRWNGRKEHLDDLAAEITDLYRLQYPGRDQSLTLISQAAKRFLRLLPLKWVRHIREAALVETIDNYLYVAQQLVDDNAAKWQQERAWRVTQHLPPVTDVKGKNQLLTDPLTGKAKPSKVLEEQIDTFEKENTKPKVRFARPIANEIGRQANSQTDDAQARGRNRNVPGNRERNPRYPADSFASANQRPSRTGARLSGGRRPGP
ncbi:MAG: hypothetical protein GY737_09790, partial [Desulfobacteraceae bacterium]|nr:hypothetical protein [Desulfobacteraceae bacterium]